jgi:tetratricopeptide (TPR) repeat protein
MGVRSTQPEEDLFGTYDTDKLISIGKVSLSEEKYDRAITIFREAFDVADIEEEGEILFYIGYTQYLKGSFKEALETFSDIEVGMNDSFYNDLVLISAQIHLETFAFDKAISILKPFINTNDDGGTDLARYLLGVAYLEKGDKKQGKAYLEEVIRLLPGSALANQAKEVLNSY